MCDNFDSGTASAAAGGTTTVVCFAWQMKGLARKAAADYHAAARKSLVDYAFHLTVTDPTDDGDGGRAARAGRGGQPLGQGLHDL